jgi:hypothetical protein
MRFARGAEWDPASDHPEWRFDSILARSAYRLSIARNAGWLPKSRSPERSFKRTSREKPSARNRHAKLK